MQYKFKVEGGEKMNPSHLKSKQAKIRSSSSLFFIWSLLTLLLVLTSPAALAQTTTYDVGGSDLGEVKDNIWGPNGSGPQDSEGDRHAGTASLNYDLGFDWTCQQEDEVCIITITPGTVNITLGCEILVPNWTGYEQASEENQQEWDRFRAALDTHEQGHCDRYLTPENQTAAQNAAAAALDGQSVTVPCPNGCDPTDPAFRQAVRDAVRDLLEANQGFQDVINGMEQAQEQYDNDTNHGETQGATLHDP
jgi:predicted secreted Zn-dependent protease